MSLDTWAPTVPKPSWLRLNHALTWWVQLRAQRSSRLEESAAHLHGTDAVEGSARLLTEQRRGWGPRSP